MFVITQFKKIAPEVTKASPKKTARKKAIKPTPIAQASKAVEEARKAGLDLTFLSK
jgi:hypothetical protein